MTGQETRLAIDEALYQVAAEEIIARRVFQPPRPRDFDPLAAYIVLSKRLPPQSHNALRFGLPAYASALQQRSDIRHGHLFLCDFGQSNYERRGYLIDTVNLRLAIPPFLVSHGKKLPPNPTAQMMLAREVPRQFSNAGGSNLSSLGLYTTHQVQTSPNFKVRVVVHGRSGPRFNSAAHARTIYIHPYSRNLFSWGGAAMTQGCQAIEWEVARDLMPMLGYGGCMYLYAPVPEMQSEPFARGGLR